ncbi:hypothetical protein HYV44_00990 [Candidatus Microgenomates bacterium]|nr:hypothetical protein [Candidatus Microgenomates bacterium]
MKPLAKTGLPKGGSPDSLRQIFMVIHSNGSSRRKLHLGVSGNPRTWMRAKGDQKFYIRYHVWTCALEGSEKDVLSRALPLAEQGGVQMADIFAFQISPLVSESQSLHQVTLFYFTEEKRANSAKK